MHILHCGSVSKCFCMQTWPFFIHSCRHMGYWEGRIQSPSDLLYVCFVFVTTCCFFFCFLAAPRGNQGDSWNQQHLTLPDSNSSPKMKLVTWNRRAKRLGGPESSRFDTRWQSRWHFLQRAVGEVHGIQVKRSRVIGFSIAASYASCCSGKS